MTEHPSSNAIEVDQVSQQAVTRFYVRLGIALVAGIAVASALVWTGSFGWLLTWGEWGVLSDEDLMGFLTVMIWIIALGVLVVLFTLKRTLTRVEVKVHERDTELAAHVHEEEARFRQLLSKAEERLRAEHARLVDLADQRRQGDEEVLLIARKEVAGRVSQLRQELLDDIARLHAEETAHAAAQRQHAMQGEELRGHVETEAEHIDRLFGIIRRQTQVLRRSNEGHDGRLRTLEGSVGRTLERGRDHEAELRNLQGAFDTQRAELFNALDQRIGDAVVTGVNDRIQQAVEVVFRPGRFYKVLAGALAGGLGLVLLLSLLGATGPGLFTVRTATFGLALTGLVLAATTFVLIWSFTDAVRTLRAFAGSPLRET